MNYSRPLPPIAECTQILFWKKVDKNGPYCEKLQSHCWEWTASRNNNGYGRFNILGNTRETLVRYAHRISYTLAKGPISAGLEIDHRCNNRGCVNPEHLEATTHAVNTRRSLAGAKLRERALQKTHCPNGHPYDMVDSRGYRGCTVCRAAQKVRTIAKKRAQRMKYTTMTGREAAQLAARKARYGHREWIAWQERTGDWQAALKTPQTLKAALLAVGTQGHFYWFARGTGDSYLINWPIGLLAIRNSRYGV